jgi:Subunit ChlI of Mg-chelatase
VTSSCASPSCARAASSHPSSNVERAVGVPVVTQLDLDPAVARAVDAGLLAARLPRLLQRQLAPISAQHPQTSPTQPNSESPEAVTPARVCSIASIQTGDHGPRPVTVEVHGADGLPGYDVVGAGDHARRASRDRMRAAFINSGLTWPDKQITVNVMPAGHGTPDSALDVAIAAGILAATGRLDRTTSTNHAYVGELGLDGSIIAVSDLDRSTVERVTGLPAANLSRLRDLPDRSSPTIDPATPGTVSSAQHVARWNAPPTPTAGPDRGLGGIA